jgi:hypothetical protein
MLSPNQQKAFEAWLQKSGHLQRDCPVCKGKSWRGRPPASLKDAGWDTSGSPGAGRWKDNGSVSGFLAPVECTGCGLVLTYSLENVVLPP